MSKKEKEKWMDAVFDSMKGSQRAKPSTGLFAKIERQIAGPEAKVFSRRQWQYAAAAAILVFVLNIFALRQIIQNNELNTGTLVIPDASGQSLISNYEIYE